VTGSTGSAPGGGAGGSGGGSGTLAGKTGEPGQVRLTYITATPAVGWSVNYGAAFTDQYGSLIPAGMNFGFTGTSIGGTSGSGMTGRIPMVQTSLQTFANANNGTQVMTTAWSIPAGDAQVGTTYEVWVPMAGMTASGTTSILSFKPYYNGAVPTTSGGDGVGATAMAAGTAFTAKIRVTLVCTATGTGGTCDIFLEGGYTQEVNVQGSGSDNFLSSQVTGLAFNTAIANTIAVATSWGAAGGGQTIGSVFSRLTRGGP
jgi:hypothetical protein